jgi:hypothetical protein
MMCLSDRSTFTSTGALSGRHDGSSPLFFWKTCCFLRVCVCLQEFKLSPPIFSWYQSLVQAKGWAASTRSKGGGTATRGHHLFPLHVHYYIRVGALREAPANDIGLRSYLCQDEAIRIVYYVLNKILGPKLRFDIISTSVFELAGVRMLFGQDVRRHQSNC